VRRYYTQDAGGTCADPLQKEYLLCEQLAANAAAVARCASAAVQPLYDAIVGACAAKRRIALIVYHAYRALARLVQLLADLVLDWGAVAGIASGGDSAGDMGGAVAAAATRLAQSCVALVESISSVFEAAEQAVLELFMSRGIGSWLRELLTWLCEIAKFVVNNLWVPILCPIADFVFDMARAWVSFLESFYAGLRNVGIPIPGVLELMANENEVNWRKLTTRFCCCNTCLGLVQAGLSVFYQTHWAVAWDLRRWNSPNIPVWVGKFGAEIGDTRVQWKWLIMYLADMHYAYWPLNGCFFPLRFNKLINNTYGILECDWTTVRNTNWTASIFA
jgi:hypothetical protein